MGMEFQGARWPSGTSASATGVRRPNLKITVPTRPTNASALAMTINSVCTEPDCLSKGEFAAAGATAVTAGCAGAVAFGCGLAAWSATASRGSFDELASTESGQRDVTREGDCVPSGAIVRWVSSDVGTAAVTLASCVTLDCGEGHSARAFATDLLTPAFCCGGTEFAASAEDDDNDSCGADSWVAAAFAVLFFSSPTYQHLRLVGRSMR